MGEPPRNPPSQSLTVDGTVRQADPKPKPRNFAQIGKTELGERTFFVNGAPVDGFRQIQQDHGPMAVTLWGGQITAVSKSENVYRGTLARFFLTRNPKNPSSPILVLEVTDCRIERSDGTISTVGSTNLNWGNLKKFEITKAPILGD